jgi:serine protease Do/serine protease DegQ
MTITIVNRLFAAVAVGVVVCGGNIAADAGVRLPAEQMNGMPSLAPLLKQITTSVVTIIITGHSESAKNSSPDAGQRPRRSGNMYDLSDGHRRKASGSGVVIDAQQGLIVTNSHVINQAEEIIVSLADGHELSAIRVGSDPGTDVAVIKVQAQNLIPLTMGDSDELEVGDWVLAIGNPFQLGQTVTSGIISGLHRTNVGIVEYEDFIQTDAAIYPGQSGGALVNLRGELIGINTAFIGGKNSNPGMGFAIPINTVRSIASQLLKYGEVRRGRLGITFDEPTPSLIRSLKLSASTTSPVIVKVDKGSSAEGAGLRVGDIVSEFARISVRDMLDLHHRMGFLSVGDVAELTIVRSGKPMVIRATIADQDKNIRSKRSTIDPISHFERLTP